MRVGGPWWARRAGATRVGGVWRPTDLECRAVRRTILPACLILAACGSVQVPGPSPEAVRAYTEAGLLSRMGQYTDAAEAYDRAAELDPDSIEVWLAAARAREQLGQWDRMRERAERAHEIAPRDPRPLELLGRAHIARNELVRMRDHGHERREHIRKHDLSTKLRAVIPDKPPLAAPIRDPFLSLHREGSGMDPGSRCARPG